MRTGKELFNTLLVELNEMGLPGMSSTLDEMYRSPKFLELDPLTAIANLVQPEYQKKMNKRIQSRLRSAHLRGCPQELSNCVDSGEREYLPRGITGTLSTLDFIDAGMNVCILGPSDSGKSYLAKAIGIVACNTYKVEYLALFYKTDKFSGEIKSSEEGDILWMRLDDLLSMGDRLSLDMKDMIKIFLNDNLSEFFYYKENKKWKYELK